MTPTVPVSALQPSAPRAPHKLPADELALEALAQAQTTHDETTRLIRELRDGVARPADLRTIALTQAQPVQRVRGEGASVGVLNLTAVRVHLGVGGSSPTAAAHAPAAPANSLLVLPVHVRELEIGADPATIPAEGLVVHVLLYPTVQHAHLGRAT